MTRSYTQEYEAFIRNNSKVIGIQVNGKPYSFTIERVIALPEAIGPIFYHVDNYRSKRVVIIDIGSLNTSIMECNKLVPAYNNMVVSTLGINILRSSLAEQLSTKYCISFTDDDVEYVLREKRVLLNGLEQNDSKEIIQNAFANHVRQIINYAKSRKISFANKDIILVGGGSILLKEQLLLHFPHATYLTKEDAQFANVLSFLKILEGKNSERKQA